MKPGLLVLCCALLLVSGCGAPTDQSPALSASPARPTPSRAAVEQTAAPETPGGPTPLPLPFTPPGDLPDDCLDAGDFNPVVERFWQAQGYASLREAWDTFEDTHGEGLVASIYDATESYARYTTYQNMLLAGEYRIRIERDGAQGYAYCAVLVYPGREGPETAALLSDAVLNGEWTGFSYGRTGSEADTRRFIAENTGKAVVVRYIVSQDPSDENRVKPGFLSETMKLLWQDSYYTRFRQEPKELTEGVENPRVPTILDLSGLIRARGEVGVFLDLMADPR